MTATGKVSTFSMNFFFDKRLGYLVSTPGLDSALESLEVKAGDGLQVVLQYGTSPDSSVPSSVVTAPAWTSENLPAAATMTLGIKAEGDYSDGDLLASVSTWTHDSAAKTYTAELDLNTTQINTLLARNDSNSGNDVAAIENAQLELTFIESSGGKPTSSVNDVLVTIKHDILLGGEGTPSNAGDPDEYLLKSDAIEFIPEVTSQIGGTSADLDNVFTTTRTVGEVVAFVDADTSNQLRFYQLTSGTDAESAPDVIRPDDYSASTNQKIWKVRSTGGSGSSSNQFFQSEVILNRSEEIDSWYNSINADTGTGQLEPILIATQNVKVTKISFAYLEYNGSGDAYDTVTLDFGIRNATDGSSDTSLTSISWDISQNSGVTATGLNLTVNQGQVMGLGFESSNTTSFATSGEYSGLIVSVFFENA